MTPPLAKINDVLVVASVWIGAWSSTASGGVILAELEISTHELGRVGGDDYEFVQRHRIEILIPVVFEAKVSVGWRSRTDFQSCSSLLRNERETYTNRRERLEATQPPHASARRRSRFPRDEFPSDVSPEFLLRSCTSPVLQLHSTSRQPRRYLSALDEAAVDRSSTRKSRSSARIEEDAGSETRARTSQAGHQGRRIEVARRSLRRGGLPIENGGRESRLQRICGEGRCGMEAFGRPRDQSEAGEGGSAIRGEGESGQGGEETRRVGRILPKGCLSTSAVVCKGRRISMVVRGDWRRGREHSGASSRRSQKS